MKRFGNLYDKFLNRCNFELAHANASRHKTGKLCIVNFNKNKDGNIDSVVALLGEDRFSASQCMRKRIQDGKKERVLSIRPYNPDKIIQHGMINVFSPILRPSFTRDTYTNLKGRGLHQCVQRLKRDLYRDPEGTKYCLQIDLCQHYPCMSHDVMKRALRRKIKDRKMLELFDKFIDTMDGLSLGDPVSGWIENAVMSYFDHKVKEVYKIRYYYRFQDDMVFLSDDINVLHKLRLALDGDMGYIRQTVKHNWQIYPVDARGIDFIGYRFFHGYTLIRDSIKHDIFALLKRYEKGNIKKEKFRKSFESRMGWLVWADCYRLRKKILSELERIEKEMGEKEKSVAV